MKTHELKTDPNVFQLTLEGKKEFEIRFNDRDFNIGDALVLRETKFTGEEMSSGKPLVYTGRALRCLISCVVDQYGMQPGWVILGCKYYHGVDDLKE